MSQYVMFYVKRKNGKEAVNIGVFSRSSYVYGLVHDYVCYEKVKKLDEVFFENVRREMSAIRAEHKKNVDSIEKNIRDINRVEGSFNDKAERIEDYNLILGEDIEEFNGYEKAYDWVMMVEDMYRDSEYMDDEANEFFAGIEVSAKDVESYED